jgi:hypothetical protein
MKFLLQLYVPDREYKKLEKLQKRLLYIIKRVLVLDHLVRKAVNQASKIIQSLKIIKQINLKVVAQVIQKVLHQRKVLQTVLRVVV